MHPLESGQLNDSFIHLRNGAVFHCSVHSLLHLVRQERPHPQSLTCPMTWTGANILRNDFEPDL